MSIKICDAIMGSGKTSAAIRYMNEHPQQKFIYITPYLDEAARIRDACPALHFQEPRNDLPEFGFRKFRHTVDLISKGENITSTHSLFLRYTEEIVNKIQEYNYTLIIDEAVDVICPAAITENDLELLDTAGWITEGEHNTISIKPNIEYKRGLFDSTLDMARGNRLIDISEDNCSSAKPYCWLFSEELLRAFRDIYVLTYFWGSQMMCYELKLLEIDYEIIGIRRDSDGEYHFGIIQEYIPEYTSFLKQKIRILENKKLNAIGNPEHALSHTWYNNSRNKEKIETMRKNILNFFQHYNKDKDSSHRLWTTFKNAVGKLRSKGFYNSYLAYNAKATNEYRDKDVLVFAVNVFMNPFIKNYLIKNGVDVHEDEYALSVMIQWIWRSAIREGNDIWIYIPSRRMRELFIDWINQVSEEKAETEQFELCS